MNKVIIVILIFVFSCCKAQKDNVNNNITELSKKINLAYSPLRTKWIVIKQGNSRNDGFGPNDYQLLCLMEFDESQIQELKKRIIDLPDISNTIYLEKNNIKDWYSASVKKCFSEEDGYYRINTTVYDAKVFAKIPYNDGFFFITDDNMLLLIMYTT